MKKLILFIVVSVLFSCKKEPPVKKHVAPVPITYAVQYYGSAIFYIQTVNEEVKIYISKQSENYSVLRYVDKTGMIPEGWIPDCKTQGWGVHYTDTAGVYFYKATDTNGNLITSGNFTFNIGCQSIKI